MNFEDQVVNFPPKFRVRSMSSWKSRWLLFLGISTFIC